MWGHATLACFVWVGVSLGTEFWWVQKHVRARRRSVSGATMVDIIHEGWSPFTAVIVSSYHVRDDACGRSITMYYWEGGQPKLYILLV